MLSWIPLDSGEVSGCFVISSGGDGEPQTAWVSETFGGDPQDIRAWLEAEYQVALVVGVLALVNGAGIDGPRPCVREVVFIGRVELMVQVEVRLVGILRVEEQSDVVLRVPACPDTDSHSPLGFGIAVSTLGEHASRESDSISDSGGLDQARVMRSAPRLFEQRELCCRRTRSRRGETTRYRRSPQHCGGRSRSRCT